jgi:uncharacterized membrane protein YfcA
LPAIAIISYAVFAVLLFYCAKWFIQGLKGTHRSPSEPTVKVKSWLLGRTILAWFLVLLFCSMAASSARLISKRASEPEQDSESRVAYGIGEIVGSLSLLAGIGLSLSWTRKLNREWDQSRRIAAEEKTTARLDSEGIRHSPSPVLRALKLFVAFFSVFAGLYIAYILIHGYPEPGTFPLPLIMLAVLSLGATILWMEWKKS